MLQNILKYTKWGLFAITIILLVLFAVNVVPMADNADKMASGYTDAILGWALALFIICALVAVAFPVYEFIKQLISDPKSAVKTVIMVGAIAVIAIIAYVTASGAEDSICETLVETNETELKWSGAGLNTLYITLGISLLAVIYAELIAKKLN